MEQTNPVYILVINPGSTSTKISLFNRLNEVSGGCARHETHELTPFSTIADQRDFRFQQVKDFLDQELPQGFGLSACIGRGGLLAPMSSGVYTVNQGMLDDLKVAAYGEHASNLGAAIAYDIGQTYNCPSYIADPVVVDEMLPLCRYSGMPEIPRKSIFHALNQKAVGRRAAAELGKPYNQCRFIVAHMGGGISVGAHLDGKVVDVNNALDGDGPFSPERSGGLPAGQLIEEFCRVMGTDSPASPEGKAKLAAFKRRIVGKGGVSAYAGTNNMLELGKKALAGDPATQELLQALIHQISKEIASHGATLEGQVDGIILTGGLAYEQIIVNGLSQRLDWIGRMFIYPGEGEMEALAENAYGALQGTLEVRTYERK